MEIRHFFKCTLALLLFSHSASFAQQQATQNVTKEIPPAWGNRSVRVINPFGQDASRSSENSPNKIARKSLTPSTHVISNQLNSRGQAQQIEERQLEMLPIPQLELKTDNHRANRVALVGPLNSHVEKTSGVWESPATSYSNHDSNSSPLNYRETPHGELSIDSSATHPAAFETAPRPEYEPYGVESHAPKSFQAPATQQPVLPIHTHQAEYHSAAPCVDEWAGFCQPKNMAWECDCRLIPRPDQTLAGCRSCRGSRCLLLPRPGIFARRAECGCTATNCNCNYGASVSHSAQPQSLQPSQKVPANDHGSDPESTHLQSNQSTSYTNANTVKGAVPALFGEIQAARRRNATRHQGGIQQQQPACLQCGLSGANCRCNRR